MDDDVLFQSRHMVKHFTLQKSITETISRSRPKKVHAVDDVSLTIHRGEVMGLIGESGSGKTTFGWIAAKLLAPTSGSLIYDGIDVSGLSGEELRRWRHHVQIVFQDPITSLNPRLKVWRIVGEPLMAAGVREKAAIMERVEKVLIDVGLPERSVELYPHEFSGGGRQRISLARALILDPEMIVLDEPTSALDVAVQAQILNRLIDLQKERNLTYLFISHNIGAVRYISDTVAIMYLGKVMELGKVRDVMEKPLHPYTRALLLSVPVPDPVRRKFRFRIKGEIPTLVSPPPGCRFAGRCPFVRDRCRTEEPVLRGFVNGHTVACHFAEELEDKAIN